MFNVEKILVPTDFSECSNYTLDIAIDFAEKFNVNEMVIMHVLPNEESWLSVHVPSDKPDYSDKNIEIIAYERLKNLELEYPKLKNIKHDFVIKRGSIYEEIINEIKRSSMDVVIIGAHGKSNLHDFFLGSIAEKIARRSNITTIITRKKLNV